VFFKKATNLDELVESISLPKFDLSTLKTQSEEPKCDAAVKQLRHLVTAIVETYRENPFHNFDVSILRCFRLLPLGIIILLRLRDVRLKLLPSMLAT
jgi:hypothetical protein